MTTYQAVYRGGQDEIVEKKSRFIAHVAPVSTVEEAQEFIDGIKKQYWDARHNCSAFSVGIDTVTTRSSDDGEPSGTAGKPILEVIMGSGIHNIVIVVTRYFGGTLLGTGGLVRAYTQAARAGIEACVVIEKIPAQRIVITTDYTDLGRIQYILAENKMHIEYSDYGEKVILYVLFSETEKDRVKKQLVEATSGRVRMEEQQKIYYAVADGEVILFPDEI